MSIEEIEDLFYEEAEPKDSAYSNLDVARHLKYEASARLKWEVLGWYNGRPGNIPQRMNYSGSWPFPPLVVSLAFSRQLNRGEVAA